MSDAEIRSVIIPLTDLEILIPNATVAEVINYSEPQPISNTPPWMLGNLLWQGWQVPLISFAVLSEVAEEESTESARVCITKSLIGNARMPYFALLTQGFPHLTTVTASDLVEVASSNKPLAVAGQVILNEERQVIVPDLDRLGHLVAHVAFGALPVTRRAEPPSKD